MMKARWLADAEAAEMVTAGASDPPYGKFEIFADSTTIKRFFPFE
jgi:hypothetical protein